MATPSLNAPKNGLEKMTDSAWEAGFSRSLMVRLAGDSTDEVDARGERVIDDTFLILLNAHDAPMMFNLPQPPRASGWERILDTGEIHWSRTVSPRGNRYRLRPRSLALLISRYRVES
jgi:glycogen operon protein